MTSPSYDVEVFFDGDCPLCMREIRMLQRKDTESRIQFTDIAGPGFRAADYGRTQDDFMAKIHGRLGDGTWIEGPEVFRQLYAAIGFKRLANLSRAPGIDQAVGLAYQLFAKNRLKLTGRCTPEGCTVPNQAS